MRVPAALACLLLVLGLAACGDKDKTSAPTTAGTTTTGDTTGNPAPPPPPATTLEVTIPSQPVGPNGTAAVDAYRAYLKKHAAALVKQSAKFTTALKRGDPETAVKTYPKVRAAYERVQPVAVRLGLEADLNALEGTVPDGDWRGFHQIEKTIFDTGMTAGTEKSGPELTADVQEIRQSIDSLEIDPAWILTDLNVALLRAAANMAPEEEHYSLQNLSAASGNSKTAQAAWKALRPLVVAEDEKLAGDIDSAIETLYITVESMKTPAAGYRRYDDLSEDDVAAVINAADAARAALIPVEQYLSN